MQIRRRKPFGKRQDQNKRTRVNEWIKIPQVQVVDESGNNLGIISTSDALQKARDLELDLVEVNPKARPSICKIMDYGKYKYEQDKQAHKQKVATKKTEIKGIRLTFRIKGGDLENRVSQAKKFMADGHQVKIEMMLKGREKAHQSLARETISDFVSQLGEIKIISPVNRQGGKFFTVVAPMS